MKSERHQGNALTGASIKITNICYNKYKCKNPDRSELLTKDLKVATDCTVSVSYTHLTLPTIYSV